MGASPAHSQDKPQISPIPTQRPAQSVPRPAASQPKTGQPAKTAPPTQGGATAGGQSSPSQAQDAVGKNQDGLFGLTDQKSGGPVSVEADQGIEWQQQRQVYIARGNAKAVRGDVTVYGQTLTAFYRKTPSGGSDIWRLDADDAVKIATPTDTALGDKGVYDVDNGVFVLTGKRPELDTPKGNVTARDSLEFWRQRNYAVARGDAKAVREDKTVTSDVLTAYFKPDQKGELTMSSIEAFNNVQIATPSAVARAIYADYNLDSGIADLKGSVKITRGEDQLNGECATVNFNTGISRLYACTKEDRVRGLLIPKQGEGIGPVGPDGKLAPAKPAGGKAGN
jgi:lipopolysaccharide export system protein LptA